MRVKWSHLSNGAFIEFPMWTIAVAFDSVPIPPGGGLIPISPGGMGIPPGPHITSMLEAHPNEVRPGQMLEVRLLDDKAKVMRAHTGIPLQWFEMEAGYPLFAPAGVIVGGWPLPGPGRYQFDFLVDGIVIGKGPDLYAHLGGGDIPAPPGLPAKGFELEWAHMAHKVEYRGGFPIIEKIMEFHVLPQGTSGVFNGFYVCSISGGTRVGRQHRFSLEMRDANGKTMRHFNEGPITFESARAGHLYRAMMAMTMENVLFPKPGEYEFVASIDGNPVGGMTFWIVPKSQDSPTN
jgi:uncharacterized protein DUF6941